MLAVCLDAEPQLQQFHPCKHTDSGILLIPLVASLVDGCGREVCALLLLLLGQTAADGGKGSLGAP